TPTTRTRLPLGKGSGDVTCPSGRSAHHTRSESRTSPSSQRSGTSTCPLDLLVCTPALRPGGPGPSRAITAAGTLQDDRRNPRGTKDEIQDDSDARRLPTVYFLQCPTTVPHDSGEDGDFHAPLMYAAPPCDYKRRRRAPLSSLWTLVCLVSPASLFKRTCRDY